MNGSDLTGLVESNSNKRHKPEIGKENAVALKSQLRSLFCTIWEKINSQDARRMSNPIEIEARIGMIGLKDTATKRIYERHKPSHNYRMNPDAKSSVGVMPLPQASKDDKNSFQFDSGVDELFLQRHVRNALSSKNGFIAELEPEKHVRISDKKRLDAAFEQSELPDSKFNPEVYDSERIKYRTCFRSEKYKHWRVDVTEVLVKNRNEKDKREFEIEMELDQSAIVGDEDGEFIGMIAYQTVPTALINEIADSLYGLINLLIPHDDVMEESPSLHLDERKVYEEGYMRINREVLGCVDQPRRFPGSMPFNMSRKLLTTLRDEEYFITEKSDGVRFLMYTMRRNDNTTRAVFVNRRGDMYDVVGSDRLGLHLKENNVFDGEFVFHKEYKRHVFLVFDVLALDGRSLVEEPFKKRLDVMVKLFDTRVFGVGGYLEGLHTKHYEDLIINRKFYYPKDQIRALLTNIKDEDGGKFFRDDSTGATKFSFKCHRSDGIILQPNREYKFYSDPMLLKWKWPDMRSVDLEISTQSLLYKTTDVALVTRIPQPTGGGGSYASSGGNAGVQGAIDCTKRGSSKEGLGLGIFDMARLKGDARSAGLFDRKEMIIVAEFVYDVDVGQWKYCRLRSDKLSCNFVNVVLNVLMEQAENVTIEELELVLLGGSGSNLQDYLAICRERFIESAREQVSITSSADVTQYNNKRSSSNSKDDSSRIDSSSSNSNNFTSNNSSSSYINGNL